MIVVRIHDDSVRVLVLTSQVGMDGSWLRGATRKHIDEDVEIGLRTVGNVIGTHRNLAVWKRGLLQIYLRERRRVCERVAAAAESSREGVADGREENSLAVFLAR